MKAKFCRLGQLFSFLGLFLMLLALPAESAASSVVVLRVKGAVSPVMASYLDRGITEAEARDAQAVIIQLDTPGGLDTSMRDIVQRINAAIVPVVVYVSPAGARAASAGVFITMASHVAVMAPNTAIGAAHPVAGGGGELEGAMADKVTNDAVAYIRGIAEQRGRNADWGEQAVRESVSLEGNAAVDERVVDFVAPNLESLINDLDGRTVTLPAGDVTISTTGAPIVPVDMNFIEIFLFAISDPNVAYLLLSLAMLALFLEFSNPGAMLPGIIGAICLLTALFGLGMLPVNIAGLLLMLLGFALLVAEVWVVSHGLFAIGGIVAVTIGSFILISGGAPELQVNRWLIAGVVSVMGTFFLFIAGAVVASRRTKYPVGTEALIGARGVARTLLDPEGTIFVRGELWQARSAADPIQEGEYVRVTSLEGLKLFVEKTEAVQQS